ncbi:aspartate ammonia-lyase [Candidatus Micrarchaeota archaeon]|nr:aspartate ammonia-lyase [Candidatus Micrarchaeota archaeon]
MRIEKDFLGSVQVPDDAYWGVFTKRANENFSLSGMKAKPVLIKAYGIVKKSAAEANFKLGLLEERKANAIIAAAQEVVDGKLDAHFPLDAFQAGAGTPFNMNANEVIANRALEMLGEKRGEYSKISPNNDVNMAQSSNDVTPTAIRVATLLMHGELLENANALAASLRKKGKEYAHVVKTGRTHLQDAVPISVQQEFNAFALSIENDAQEMEHAAKKLAELGIGGTAIGTGINTHPKFAALCVERIGNNSGLEVYAGKDLIELTSSMNAFLNYSSAMRSLAVSLVRISNDLKLLSSGPKTAIGEYYLPEVEPGSSIMPGKINPSIPEAAEMCALQAIACDHAVLLACKGGQLQLNMLTPLITYNVLFASELLANACEMFSQKCISGIIVDEKKCHENLFGGLILATALNPYFGYNAMSDLVKEALKRGISIREIILEKKLLSKEQVDELLSPQRLISPQEKKKL